MSRGPIAFDKNQNKFGTNWIQIIGPIQSIIITVYNNICFGCVKETFLEKFLVCAQNSSTSTSYTLPSHLTTIAQGGWGGCCIRKRENDRKVRSIVDRKPEKKV